MAITTNHYQALLNESELTRIVLQVNMDQHLVSAIVVAF